MSDKEQISIKMKIKHRNPEIIAFLLCGSIATIIIIPILLMNDGYFALSHDFTAEEIPFGMLMNSALKSGELWNWGIDLGGNLIEAFSFYNIGSVFNWISFLFPAIMYPRVIGWILILKIAFAGFSSTLWMKRYITEKNCLLIGAVLYAFSGAQCINIVFYHFQDVIALFPLMMFTLDELVLERKKGHFALACTVNLLCNPVFFFGSVCFTVIYYVFRFLIPNIHEKSQITTIIICCWEGILSVLMSAVITVPTILSMLKNQRATSVINVDSWLSMSTKDWLTIVSALFLPSESMDSYSSIFTTNWGSWNAYLPLCGMVFVIAYISLKKNWLSRMLITCMIIVSVPILNSMFIAFSPSPERYARWLFMMVLLEAVATAKVIENLQDYRKQLKYGSLGSLGLLLFYWFMVSVMPWGAYKEHIVFRELRFAFNIACSVFGILLCMWLCCIKSQNKLGIFRNAVICMSAGLFAVTILDYQRGNLDNTNVNFYEFSNTYSKNVGIYLTEIPLKLKQDVLPYRYYFDEGIGYTYYNFSMVNGLPSINSFTSTCHPSIMKFYQSIGSDRYNMTRVGPTGTAELLGAKYLVTREQRTDLKLIQSIENELGQCFYIYDNVDAIPLGTVYDSYITKSEFETTAPDVRALVMLHTLVIEDSDEADVEKVLQHDQNYQTITNDSRDRIMQERKNNNSTSFEKKKNAFTNVVTAECDAYAFYSVPYDQFWHVTVNGKKTKTYDVNGLTAVPVVKGENSIEFRYIYAPLKWAFIMTMIGGILFIIYMPKTLYKKDKEI